MDHHFPSSAFVGGIYTLNTIDPSLLCGPTPPPPSTAFSQPSQDESLFGDGVDVPDSSDTNSSDDDVPLVLLVQPGRRHSKTDAGGETMAEGRPSWVTPNSTPQPRLSAKAKGKQRARGPEDEPRSPDLDAAFEEAALDAVLPFRELSSGSEYEGSGLKQKRKQKNQNRSPKKRQVKVDGSTREVKEEVSGKRTVRQPARYRDGFVAHGVLRVDVDDRQDGGVEGREGPTLVRRVPPPGQSTKRGRRKTVEAFEEDIDDSYSFSSSSSSGSSTTSDEEGRSEDEMVDVKTYAPKPKYKQVLIAQRHSHRDLPLETLESYCHQCRCKTNRCKLSCKECKTTFCNRCLVIRCVFRVMRRILR